MLIGLHDDGGYARNFFRGPLGWPVPGVRRRAPRWKAVVDRFAYCVYFASDDPNSAAQVLKWFRYGFVPKEKTIVLGRYRPRSVAALIRAFEQAGVHYAFFKRFRDVDVQPLRAILYPYNTNSNVVLVKRRGPKHIWIGHGESDKAASISPVIRIYDHLFVSGQSAIDRLLEARIINRCDVGTDRLVKVGMPYLAPPEGDGMSGRPASVLYCPTWEGVDVHQQYCSLAQGFGVAVIDWLLDNTDLQVVFRPHPSTGQKQRHYQRYVADILERFGDNERFSVHGDVHGTVPSARQMRRLGDRARWCTPSESMAQAGWVVTDVSSMMSLAIYYGRPFVLVVKPCAGASATRDERLAKAAFGQVRHGAPLPRELARAMGDGRVWRDASQAVQDARALCCDVEPYLQGVPTAQMLDVIVDALWGRDAGGEEGAPRAP